MPLPKANSWRSTLRLVQLASTITLASTAPAADITFQGLSTTSIEDARSYIKSQIEYIQKNGATTARADDAAFFLQRSLRHRGHDQATVNWQLQGDTVRLTVKEGSQKILQTVNATGNTTLEDSGIRELITSRTRDQLKIPLGKPVPFVPDDIRHGISSIIDYYHLLGYKDAKVTLVPDPPTAPTITLQVFEGTLHQISEITLPEPPTPDLAEALTTLRENHTTQPFTSHTTTSIARELESLGKAHGYYDTTATAAAKTFRPEGTTTQVDILATADFGQRYKISRIKVSGNEKIKDRFFQRKLLEFDGNPYDPQGISKFTSDLLRTGSFKKVITTPTPQKDGTIVLDVEVEEAKTVKFGPYIGYGTYEGIIAGFTYRDANLFGLVRGLGIDAEYTSRGLRGDIFYNDKWFLWSDWELTFGISTQTEQNEGYTKWETGLRAELRRTFLEQHSLSLFATTSLTDITEFEIAEKFLGPENYITSTLGFRYDYGLAPNGISDHQGFEFGSSAAIGIADIPFFRTSARAAYHWPITENTLLSLGARSTAIVPLGTEELLPIDLRTFNGGARTVRSFRERALGPRDNSGFPLGGEFSTAFNAQLEFPLPKAPHGLKGIIFADAGNLTFEFKDAGLTNLNYAAGLGIRYNTPIGPLRIDYGHNLNRQENEPSGSVHIGFGYAF